MSSSPASAFYTNIVYGVDDDFHKPFDPNNWLIMNKQWVVFSASTLIQDYDLWNEHVICRTLSSKHDEPDSNYSHCS